MFHGLGPFMAKKKRSQGSGLSGEEAARLRELVDLVSIRGHGPNASQSHIESLRESLSKSPRLALALVESLGDVKTPLAGELLTEISGLHSDKRYRKAVKRAAYRLRNAGCLREDEEKGARGEGRRVLVKGPEPLAPYVWASRVDPTGTEAVIMALPAGSEQRIALFVVDGKVGIRNLESAQASRAGAEKVLRNFRREKGLDAREIPLAHGAHLVRFGLDVAKARGLTPPRGAHQLFDRLKELCGPAPPSLVSSIMEAGGDSLAEHLKRSADAAKWETFRAYLLPQELIVPHAEKLRSLKDSPIVLPGSSQASMRADIIDEALAASFTQEVKSDLMFRLRETAVHLYLDGDRDESFIALALAQDLAEDEGPSPGNLFCMALVERSLNAAGADLEQQTKPEGTGLIEIP